MTEASMVFPRDSNRTRSGRLRGCDAWATVADRLPIRADLAIPLSEVTVRASRSSGPGGQHANVTASRIEASFDVLASDTLSDAQKARIMGRCGRRVTAVAQD